MSTQPPRQIDFGAHTYDVEPVCHLPHGMRSEVDHRQCVIRMSRDQSLSRQREALLGCVADVAAHNKGDSTQPASGLSTPLLDVLRSNPDLVAYLTGGDVELGETDQGRWDPNTLHVDITDDDRLELVNDGRPYGVTMSESGFRFVLEQVRAERPGWLDSLAGVEPPQAGGDEEADPSMPDRPAK